MEYMTTRPIEIPKHRTYSFISHEPMNFTNSLMNALARNGWKCQRHSPMHLIMDTPAGHGLEWLKRYPNIAGQLVIVTENTCACYLEWIWDQNPAALVCGRDARQITLALETVSDRQRFRNTPAYMGLLTPTERKVLHHAAHGLTNGEIATLLKSQEGTTRNQLSSLQHKLQAKYPNLWLENRTHLTMYYWGLWIPLKRNFVDDSV